MHFLKDYSRIERPVKNAIAAEFFVQMVNATFMNILPLYMLRQGYSEKDIALHITFRFIGVLLLALPIGTFIKSRKVYRLFTIAAVSVSVFGVAIVMAIDRGSSLGALICLLLWGASFTFMQIPIFPFILRNCAAENHTPAIALSYSTWSFGGIVSGLLIVLLDMIDPDVFNEKFILIFFSVSGLCGLIFLARTRSFEEKTELADPSPGKFHALRTTDWPLVLKALTPTLIIATGAGLTIPFISLFFDRVHGLDKGEFSTLSFTASLLVAYGALLVPRIKQQVGYRIAIPATQSLAIMTLVALATTEYYNQYTIAVYIAGICYLLRQPLMNMAGPMTSELVLNYVGKKNREITSALTSAIWSGSWVVSGFMVTVFFAYGLSFVNVFLVTALQYAFGVFLYYLLILDYGKRPANENLQ